MGLMMLPRTINENTDMQAAAPVIEINRLFDLLGIGITTLQSVAFAIMFISGLSIFVSLYTRLKDREYEIALMRTMGAGRFQLFSVIITEGLLLCLAGFASGMLFSRLALLLISNYSMENYHLSFAKLHFTLPEIYLLAATLGIGFVAALLPALKALTINISKTLSNA